MSSNRETFTFRLYLGRESISVPPEKSITHMLEIIAPVYEVGASKRELQLRPVVWWMLEQRKGQEPHPVKTHLNISSCLSHRIIGSLKQMVN